MDDFSELGQLRLYLVERTDKRCDVEYYDFIAVIVAAYSEYDARLIPPCDGGEDNPWGAGAGWIENDEISSLSVTWMGRARIDTTRGVIFSINKGE